ncbi:hypothetical protein H4582DRAFT_2056050 [Lactarius indigo]|nr:hypothetical protein H4582DRAFT_2056050 [Lactarius indigo]
MGSTVTKGFAHEDDVLGRLRGGFDPVTSHTIRSSLLALSGRDDGAAAGLGSRGPLVLLAYKEFDPGERWPRDTMAARQVGVALERIGSEAGAEDASRPDLDGVNFVAPG